MLLDLIGNGCPPQAVEDGASRLRPTLKVTTHDLGEAVDPRPRQRRRRHARSGTIVQPFFATKPTGEGTGLGLSISYDIVTQQHGGTITVDSRVGEFTEFAVRLPRTRGATTQATVTSEAAG